MKHVVKDVIELTLAIIQLIAVAIFIPLLIGAVVLSLAGGEISNFGVMVIVLLFIYIRTIKPE